MEKSRKKIAQHLSMVDHALYLLDARCPTTCLNTTFLSEIASGHRQKISFVLNKSDLAPHSTVTTFVRHFRQHGYPLFPTVSHQGRPHKRLSQFLDRKRKQLDAEMRKKGRLPRPIRIMVLGIPNVGKSTLLNQFAGKRQAITGQKAGVTRGLQWVKSQGGIDFMDTPGVLFPRIRNMQELAKLVLIGSVRREALGEVHLEDVVGCLLPFLWNSPTFQDKIDPKKRLQGSLPDNPQVFFEHVAKRYGFILPGQEADMDRALEFIISRMLKGELGAHCYDRFDSVSETLSLRS